MDEKTIVVGTDARYSVKEFPNRTRKPMGVVFLLTTIVVVEPTIFAAWADVFIISSPTIFVGHVGF
jgi:hypothetical protein